jgi:hypothetical protein
MRKNWVALIILSRIASNVFIASVGSVPRWVIAASRWISDGGGQRNQPAIDL